MQFWIIMHSSVRMWSGYFDILQLCKIMSHFLMRSTYSSILASNSFEVTSWKLGALGYLLSSSSSLVCCTCSKQTETIVKKMRKHIEMIPTVAPCWIHHSVVSLLWACSWGNNNMSKFCVVVLVCHCSLRLTSYNEQVGFKVTLQPCMDLIT